MGSFGGVFALVMDFIEVMLISPPEMAHCAPPPLLDNVPKIDGLISDVVPYSSLLSCSCFHDIPICDDLVQDDVVHPDGQHKSTRGVWDWSMQ